MACLSDVPCYLPGVMEKSHEKYPSGNQFPDRDLIAETPLYEAGVPRWPPTWVPIWRPTADESNAVMPWKWVGLYLYVPYTVPLVSQTDWRHDCPNHGYRVVFSVRYALLRSNYRCKRYAELCDLCEVRCGQRNSWVSEFPVMYGLRLKQ